MQNQGTWRQIDQELHLPRSLHRDPSEQVWQAGEQEAGLKPGSGEEDQRKRSP